VAKSFPLRGKLFVDVGDLQQVPVWADEIQEEDAEITPQIN
jgi:hypothetical protein